MSKQRRTLLSVEFFVYKEPYWGPGWGWRRWLPYLRAMSSANDRWRLGVYRFEVHFDWSWYNGWDLGD